MLEIDVKLLPYGSRKTAKVLHRITIANDGDGTAELGNYTCVLREGSQGRILDTTKLYHFRREEFTSLHLLHIILSKFIRRINVRNQKDVQTAINEGLLSSVSAPDTEISI